MQVNFISVKIVGFFFSFPLIHLQESARLWFWSSEKWTLNALYTIENIFLFNICSY